MKKQRTFNDEVVCDEMAAILRAKTPAERLNMIDDMRRFVRTNVRAAVVWRDPTWDSARVDGEVARRMSLDSD